MKFKKLMPTALLSVLVLLFNLLIGCTELKVTTSSDTNTVAPSNSVSAPMFSNRSLLQEIYCLDRPDYSVYASEVLDIYFISCALYFDFQSQQLLPEVEQDAFYRQVKNYFTPYKNHPFIEELENFVDVENRAHKDGVVYPLLMYAFSQVDYGLDVDSIQSNAFQNGEEFHVFLESLYQFYLDTNAQEFFQSAKLQTDMTSYLKREMALWPIESLFSGMESYVGNKSSLFPGQSVKYRSIMTLYRPFNASFYTIHYGNDVYLIGQQSPNDESRKADQFDIKQIMNTTIHEFLHTFINQPVYEQNEYILQLTKDLKKSSYIGPMYQNMEWHRIVDENIVRVVETAIFSDVMDNKQMAFDFILKKEIQFGGMPKLEGMYDSLSLYEADRDKFKTIDSYLPDLITIMFS